MENIDSMYSAPQSDPEITVELPEQYLKSDISSNKLAACAWLAILESILLLPLFAFSFMSGFAGDNATYQYSSLAFEIISLFVWLYYFFIFKKLINLRFEFVAADIYFNLLIALSIITTLFSIAEVTSESIGNNVDIVNLIILIVIGVVYILFGRKLLKAKIDYPYIKALSWVSLVTGVSLATVVLFFVAIPLSLVLGILTALILFKAAAEKKKFT